MSNIVVYKDTTANAIVLGGHFIGVRFVGELQAVGNGDGTVNVINLPKTEDAIFNEVYNTQYGVFVDENETPLGVSELSTVNALNAIFQDAGTPGGEVPVITSSLAINVVNNVPLNYTLIATYAVGYIWANLPTGIAVKNGDDRNILGIVSTGVGTYNVSMTAVNYNGSDTQTLVITVGASFVNTKSIRFKNHDSMSASATTSNPFYRASDPGAAWSTSMWFKASNNTNTYQTITSFGSLSGGHVDIYYEGRNNRRISIFYGDSSNSIVLRSPADAVEVGIWYWIGILYTGISTTGDSPYSGFKMYIGSTGGGGGGGALVALTGSGSGYSGSIPASRFYVSESVITGNHQRNSNLDELAIWASDQSANMATIYNSGVTQNMGALGTPPTHWWRMGDGDTFPIIEDNEGALDFTMLSMVSGDIVNDAP